MPLIGSTIILLNLVFSVKRYLRAFAGLFCTSLFVSPLLAHPGHGHEGATHYLVTAEHQLPVLVVFALLLFVFNAVLRGRVTRLLAKR
ncbi:MAG TPA: hypothetical protein DEF45_01655 [Rhodopirellula sp.]|nr:hypothetical protein [Rhodopirellula sp.]